MSSLLVQSCSASKHEPAETVPALQLYSGYFFKIIKKAMRDGVYNDSVDLRILSAEHGIVEPTQEIGFYDRRMDSERAERLAPQVSEQLSAAIDSEYDKLLMNVGREYREALQRAEEELNVPIYYIEAGGIGYKGQVLKRFIRGETSVESSESIVAAQNI